MAEDNRSLNSAETNNETSWYKAFGAGLLSGAIKIPEGVISLGAELIDLGADSDTASSVEEFFDKINIFEDTAEERTIGKLTEAITQIAVPGGIGFKAANAAARKMTTKALKAKRKGVYAEFGKKGKTPDSGNLRSALQKVNDLNKRSKYKRFAADGTGGAAGAGVRRREGRVGARAAPAQSARGDRRARGNREALPAAVPVGGGGRAVCDLAAGELAISTRLRIRIPA